ncbi:ATP-binding protein [Paeniglutamicibacter sp. NPDC012692]|uniref:ATP-binding protein n=1 Tax=Paeniglutamicibacter sp. NPDC012692 TaxID=3364388 RepID=UPI0036854F4A
MSKISVHAGRSLLVGLVKTPHVGLRELIWNAFDADAENVIVIPEQSPLGGWDTLTVSDDGTGMNEISANASFSKVGDSWKAPLNSRSEIKKRPMHGRHGRGRYAAFSLGEYVTWTSTVDESGSMKTVAAQGVRSDLTTVDVTPVETGELKRGTSVRITALSTECIRDLDKENYFRNEVISEFALHLDRYEDFRITIFGEELNPKSVQLDNQTFSIPNPEGTRGKIELTVIEWDIANVERRLYLVSDEGSIIDEMPPGIQAPGSEFTAYLKWAGFTSGQPLVMEDDEETPAGKVIQAAKNRLREHMSLSMRRREKETIEKWRREGVYPYVAEPKSETEKTARSAFNVVAQAFSRTVEASKSTDLKKMALGLLKEAFEQSPESVLPILQSVAKLPKTRVDELTDLLDRTELASLISAGRMVGDRLDFIQALNALVFDKLSRKHTKERRQLHRILAQETWIFGEEWSLTGDDVRLTEVLKNHLAKLDQDAELASGTPVLREDGRDGIPDLVLGRKMRIAKNSYEQLVVELKRPGHTLEDKDVMQIRSYASAIKNDPRFDQQNVSWEFWLIGTDMKDTVNESRNQPHLPPGVIQASPYRIVVKTWAEVISEAEFRLQFVQESLDYASDHDKGISYVRERYAEYLPPELAVEEKVSA